MKDFIDLKGASGASYRFRLWAEGTLHPPIAGNYALVREEAGRAQVRAVGETHDLSDLPRQLKPLEAGVHIFTRLNVAKAVRLAEHEDLMGQLQSQDGGGRGAAPRG